MKYGLIGEKLVHSFSKEIHESFAPYKYELCEVSKSEFHSFMSQRNFKAINVTIPYKETVIPYLSFIDEKAKIIGAVNTIVNKNGKLFGYNTDFDGMCLLLEKNNFDFKNKKVLILGTGGTSKTSYLVSEYLGAREIIKVSRFGKINYDNVKNLHSNAEIIINTTPCGMYPNIHAKAISLDGFENLEGVCDVVYNPLKTELILEAEEKNVNYCSGLYMLVSQAIFASEIFLEKKFECDVYQTVYRKILNKKLNIVLVGMPGCGKTTFGEIISKELGLNNIDTDKLIVSREKEEISNIILSQGEKYFRDIESSVIEEISLKNGYVISTGGGSILRSENVKNLKRNGVIIFLNRNIEDIVPTDSRPLSSNRSDLEKLYKERLPIYKRICDIEIKSEKTIQSVVEKIIRVLRKM